MIRIALFALFLGICPLANAQVLAPNPAGGLLPDYSYPEWDPSCEELMYAYIYWNEISTSSDARLHASIAETTMMLKNCFGDYFGIAKALEALLGR